MKLTRRAFIKLSGMTTAVLIAAPSLVLESLGPVEIPDEIRLFPKVEIYGSAAREIVGPLVMKKFMAEGDGQVNIRRSSAPGRIFHFALNSNRPLFWYANVPDAAILIRANEKLLIECADETVTWCEYERSSECLNASLAIR